MCKWVNEHFVLPLVVCTPAECPNERHTCHVEISARGLPVPECQCKCQGEFCQTSEPVCANNKQTYNSFSEFDVTRCENPELDLELAYWGECQGKDVITW